MSKTAVNEIMELRQMKVPELITRYEEVMGKPPRSKNRTWLWRRISWKLQEERLGGLSKVAKRQLEEQISKIELPQDQQRACSGVPHGNTRALNHKAGAVITRVWRGRKLRAVSTEDGYEFEGATYRSLSAIAKAVTGTHWNGRLFFGLTKRKKRHG